jgi:RNA-directed DNA polymerase
MRREFHVRFSEGLGVRFPGATQLTVLIDCRVKHAWLMDAVIKRLKQELAKIQVEMNEEKSHIVDLTKGETFGFLGFDFRRVRSHRGKWRPNTTPKMVKRTALLRKLKLIFRRYQSQPISRVIKLINPILRGWVNYFAIGNSTRHFSYVRQWVEKKIRRHLMRSRKRTGFGWKRWSKRWLYEDLGLYDGYKVRYYRPRLKALPAR